jgi:hypothetical protein
MALKSDGQNPRCQMHLEAIRVSLVTRRIFEHNQSKGLHPRDNICCSVELQCDTVLCSTHLTNSGLPCK